MRRVKRIEKVILDLLELVLLVGGFFLFGLAVGELLGERKAKGVYEPFADEYRMQKRDMWKKFWKRS